MTEPIGISWSRLRKHDECPAAGDLIARGMKSPVANIRNYFHGNVVDLAMRRWLAMTPPPPGWMAGHIDELFDESVRLAKETKDGIVRWRSPADQAELREFCRELVIRLEVALNRYCLPFDWAQAWRFKVPIGVTYGKCRRQVNLKGEIDLLVFGPKGQIVIWDLKATENNDYYQKVLGQLTFYAIAVRASKAERMGRWPAKVGLLQPMCDQQVLPLDVTDQAIREMGGRIERLARDIWEGRMGPKPGSQCGWCEVKAACPIYDDPAVQMMLAG